MDEVRNERRPLDLSDAIRANMAAGLPAAGPVAMVSHTDPAPLDAVASRFVETLGREYRLHVERVAELDSRLVVATQDRDATRAERDAARAEVKRLQDDRSHVCTEGCSFGRHVAFQGRKLVDQITEERNNARKMRDETLNRIEIVARERDVAVATIEEKDAQIDFLIEERDRYREEMLRRYTTAQVGDAQASEAELVAKPLRATIARLRDRVANLEHSNALTLDRNTELQGYLDCRERRQNAAEAEVASLALTVDTLRECFRKVEDSVTSEKVGRALDTPPAVRRADHLADAVRQVRHEIRRITARPIVSPNQH